MTNAENFKNKYNELENIVKNKYNLNDDEHKIIDKLCEKQQFRNRKDKIDSMRKIRNILAHAVKINDKYIIEPSDEIISELEGIIDEIKNPPKVYDYCIKINEVFSCKKDDLIFPIMQTMKEKIYTHIPILENGVVIGVFSENTLFGALIDDELVYEKTSTKICDSLITKYCNIDNHVSECFQFIKRDTLLEDAKECFRNMFKNNKRLAMVFITQNGKKDEKLLGILTPWDIL